MSSTYYAKRTEYKPIDFFYRGIMDLKTKRVKFVDVYEILNDRFLGRMSANNYFFIAENSVRINEINVIGLDEIKNYHLVMRENFYIPEHITYFFNITTRFLESDKDYEILLATITENKYKKQDLVLSFNANTVVELDREGRGRLQNLRKHGYKVCINGFGEDYNSLDIFAEFKFDYIRLEAQYFEATQPKKKVLKMIVKFCEAEKITLIMEGIDSPAQMTRFKKEGIKLGTGRAVSPLSRYVTNEFLHLKPLTQDERAKYEVKLKKDIEKRDLEDEEELLELERQSIERMKAEVRTGKVTPGSARPELMKSPYQVRLDNQRLAAKRAALIQAGIDPKWLEEEPENPYKYIKQDSPLASLIVNDDEDLDISEEQSSILDEGRSIKDVEQHLHEPGSNIDVSGLQEQRHLVEYYKEKALDEKPDKDKMKAYIEEEKAKLGDRLIVLQQEKEAAEKLKREQKRLKEIEAQKQKDIESANFDNEIAENNKAYEEETKREKEIEESNRHLAELMEIEKRVEKVGDVEADLEKEQKLLKEYESQSMFNDYDLFGTETIGNIGLNMHVGGPKIDLEKAKEDERKAEARALKRRLRDKRREELRQKELEERASLVDEDNVLQVEGDNIEVVVPKEKKAKPERKPMSQEKIDERQSIESKLEKEYLSSGLGDYDQNVGFGIGGMVGSFGVDDEDYIDRAYNDYMNYSKEQNKKDKKAKDEDTIKADEKSENIDDRKNNKTKKSNKTVSADVNKANKLISEFASSKTFGGFALGNFGGMNLNIHSNDDDEDDLVGHYDKDGRWVDVEGTTYDGYFDENGKWQDYEKFDDKRDGHYDAEGRWVDNDGNVYDGYFDEDGRWIDYNITNEKGEKVPNGYFDRTIGKWIPFGYFTEDGEYKEF